MWVVSRRPLLESPVSQALFRDWFPPVGAMALWERMLLFLFPEKQTTALQCIAFVTHGNFALFIIWTQVIISRSSSSCMDKSSVVLYNLFWANFPHKVQAFSCYHKLKRYKVVLPCKKEGTSECEVSQCSREPSSEHVNRWSGFVGWKWTSHTVHEKQKSLNRKYFFFSFFKCTDKFSLCVVLSAEWASMSEKGVFPCLTSQTHSMPSCPPVATMCCWLGCLSTQCRGTRSPNLNIHKQNAKQATVWIFFWLQSIL